MIVWVSEVPNRSVGDRSWRLLQPVSKRLSEFSLTLIDFYTGCENVSVVSSSIQSYTYSTY